MKSLSGNSIPSDHRATFVDGQNLVGDGRKTVRIIPSADESVVALSSHRDKFANLQFMNLLLTNACNLSCSYCYEQHNKDFGRFTTHSVKLAWDWLKNVNHLPSKTMQFFGGEPLIHSKLILDFLREHRDDVVSQSGRMAVSITTNGLLLTNSFIEEYFSYPNTKMMISLDTLDAATDHREIGQDKIDYLLTVIQKITRIIDNPTRFSVRATISQENSKTVRKLWDTLYSYGVRQMVFHPLILSYADGFRNWSDAEWGQFTTDIKSIITDYPDDTRFVQIVEGVGFQRRTNCLVGSNTIAVDASGDFSGCYFFTNRKGSNTGDMLIGNVFTDELFIDRFDVFAEQYNQMFDTNDQCKSCDMRGVCYQCPAGNISTGPQLFRPDGMCQRLVRLHLDIKEMIVQMAFRRKLMGMLDAVRTHGSDILKKSMMHLYLRHFNGEYFTGDMDMFVDTSIPLERYAGCFASSLDRYAAHCNTFTPDDLISAVREETNDVSSRDLYYRLASTVDVPIREMDCGNLTDVLYVTMLHFVVANESTFGMGG